MVEPSWQGRRVSVRRVVERTGDGLRFGDVVGDLTSLDAQTAVIDTRDHGLVEVPRAHIAAARLVPASTAQELALDTLASRGLRPVDTADLGGWLLRADHGLTRRANSVLPHRQLRLPLDDALAQARAWYAERDLPLLISAPTEARRLLDAELGERGWNPVVEAHLMAARLDHVDGSGAPDDVPVEFRATPDDDWLARYRGGEAFTERGRALLTRHDRVSFAQVRLDGRTVAIARGTVDDGWLGIMAVEVDTDYRRRGLAQAVTTALWQWGREQGATRSYLQVEAVNHAAVGLYERLGYWVHHDYRYREDPETG